VRTSSPQTVRRALESDQRTPAPDCLVRATVCAPSQASVSPERAWFGDEEQTVLADAIGHPLKQIRAHI
jgi:hypothetical protein